MQVLGVECLHTRDVRRTHELLASHITYIRTMSSILHKALAVLSFECATPAIEPLCAKNNKDSHVVLLRLASQVKFSI